MNTFLTPTWYTKDVAVGWKNSVKLVGNFDRTWNDEWANKPHGAQIGYTVFVRLPNRPIVNEGQALQVQARLNQAVPVSLTHQLQIASEWSSADDALVVEEVRERYTIPDGQALGNRCDVLAGQEVYRAMWQAIGTPGTPITSYKTWTTGIARLRNMGVPGDLVAVIDPLTQSELMASSYTQFSAPSQTTEIFREGQFSGPALGINKWFYDPNMPIHTTGTFTASTPLVDGSLQTGSTLLIKGMGTYAFKAGDTFTLAGVNATNPVSFANTGQLNQFSIQADVSGSGTATLSISPPIITSGGLQTVTASPANNAAITFNGASGTIAATMAATDSRQSFVFSPKGFAWVTADLPGRLAGADAKRINDKEAQVSMRRVEQYNISTDQLPIRIDCIVGTAAIQPTFGFRAWS